jgi:hypothetical protein
VTLLLRAIRKGRWLDAVGLDWLEADDVAADPLADLTTRQNTLSVWQVDDDESNLSRIVAACASLRDNFANFDYALVDEAIVLGLGIQVRRTKGGTPDDAVNESRHRDLIELSAFTVARLAREMAAGSTRRRLPWQQVRELVKDGVRSGRLDMEKVNAKLRQKLPPREG